jgi:hypothetical protein
MENNIFVLYLKDVVIGTFNNEHLLNCFVKGGIQNNFFTEQDIKKDIFELNTICKKNKILSKEESKQISEDEERFKIQKILEDKHNNIILLEENNKKIIEENNKKIKEEKKRKLEEFKKTEEYTKIQEERAVLTNEINQLKLKKKKLQELEQEYNINLNLYKKFVEEKTKDSEFKIPELFTLKYSIYERLDKENNLNFENYKIIWEKEKPKNEYDLFKTNTYEDSFISKKEENLEIELEISI